MFFWIITFKSNTVYYDSILNEIVLQTVSWVLFTTVSVGIIYLQEEGMGNYSNWRLVHILTHSYKTDLTTAHQCKNSRVLFVTEVCCCENVWTYSILLYLEIHMFWVKEYKSNTYLEYSLCRCEYILYSLFEYYWIWSTVCLINALFRSIG